MIFLLTVLIYSPWGEPIILGTYHPTVTECRAAGLRAQLRHGEKLIWWNCEIADGK